MNYVLLFPFIFRPHQAGSAPVLGSGLAPVGDAEVTRRNVDKERYFTEGAGGG